MSKREESKAFRRQDSKRHKSKFYAEFEQLRRSPLYEKALEEVIAIEKKKGTMMIYEINFSVQYATVFGEKMAVVGGHECLGNWDPSRAVEMSWNEGNVWKCSIVVNGAISEVPYKYVCIRGTLVRWEAGDNRIIDTKNGERIANKVKVNNDDIWIR